MIPVTKPFKTPLDELNIHLNDIWDKEIYTNNGPKVQLLESRLKDFLNVKNISFVSNGTIAIQLVIKALELKGEIITTPFTYIATSSSIAWEGCKPVFVDIEKETLNINPELIEDKITSKTSAIIATHVFGNPCDVIAIDRIAKKHNLKVIYDAAHAFGVELNGKSIFEYGDISTCSTHATKIFHTIEGGLVFSNSIELIKKINFLKNFGHSGPFDYELIGINGKNSEVHAAVGIVNLSYFEKITKKRKVITQNYTDRLSDKDHLRILKSPNFSYFPILFNDEQVLVTVLKRLEENKIFTRRYFKPSLDSLPFFENDSECLNSNSMVNKILCLPIYHSLEDFDVNRIIEIFRSTIS